MDGVLAKQQLAGFVGGVGLHDVVAVLVFELVQPVKAVLVRPYAAGHGDSRIKHDVENVFQAVQVSDGHLFARGDLVHARQNLSVAGCAGLFGDPLHQIGQDVLGGVGQQLQRTQHFAALFGDRVGDFRKLRRVNLGKLAVLVDFRPGGGVGLFFDDAGAAHGLDGFDVDVLLQVVVAAAQLLDPGLDVLGNSEAAVRVAVLFHGILDDLAVGVVHLAAAHGSAQGIDDGLADPGKGQRRLLLVVQFLLLLCLGLGGGLVLHRQQEVKGALEGVQLCLFALGLVQFAVCDQLPHLGFSGVDFGQFLAHFFVHGVLLCFVF